MTSSLVFLNFSFINIEWLTDLSNVMVVFPAPLVESGEGVGEDYYLLWRLEQGVPEGSVEIPKGKFLL